MCPIPYNFPKLGKAAAGRRGMLTARPLLPWPQQFPELSPAVGKPGGVVAGTRAQQHSEPAAEQWVQKRNMKKNKNVIPAFSPCTMEFVLKASGSKLQLGKTPIEHNY